MNHIFMNYLFKLFTFETWHVVHQINHKKLVELEYVKFNITAREKLNV